MEIVIFLIFCGVVAAVVFLLATRFRGFDDPKPMSNHTLIAAIAGQADWLEKMSAAPVESQNSASIVELATKRRKYISRLCLEVLSRDSTMSQMKYPGATSAMPSVFSEAAQYAKELEAIGASKENSAVRAVKEKLFIANGLKYPSRWEM